MSKLVLDEQIRNDILQVVQKQVKDKQVLKIKYNNQWRIIEPFVLGYTRRNNMQIRQYQVIGGSLRGVTKGWKLFRIDRMEEQQFTGKYFEHPRELFNPWDKHMPKIISIQTFNKPKKEEKVITPITIPVQYNRGITQINNIRILLQRMNQQYPYVTYEINEKFQIIPNQVKNEAVLQELQKMKLIDRFNNDIKVLQQSVNIQQTFIQNVFKVSQLPIFTKSIQKYNVNMFQKIQQLMTQFIAEYSRLVKTFPGMIIGIDNKTNSIDFTFDEQNFGKYSDDQVMQYWGRIDSIAKEIVRFMQSVYGYNPSTIFRGQ